MLASAGSDSTASGLAEYCDLGLKRRLVRLHSMSGFKIKHENRFELGFALVHTTLSSEDLKSKVISATFLISRFGLNN